jgi:hypothetical protein
MSTPTYSGLIPDDNAHPFQAIGLEVWTRLWHLNQSSLAQSSLVHSYYSWKGSALSEASSVALSDLPFNWNSFDEEAVHILRLEWNRARIVASMAILESFFAATLNFGRKVVRDAFKLTFPKRTAHQKDKLKYGASLDKLRDLFGNDLTEAEEFLPAIEETALLRNSIAHDSSLYELREASPGVFYTPAKPLPEATDVQAMEAAMLVTEFTDSIFVELFVHLFGKTPAVRPLTDAIKAVHQDLRRAWREDEAKPPTIRRIDRPEWTTLEVPDGHKIASLRGMQFYAWPTGVDTLPVLFSVPGHKAHGKKARCKVDQGEWREIDGRDTRTLLEELLRGDEATIEYSERSGERPLYLGFSLGGFREAWSLADKGTPKVPIQEAD